MTSRRDELIHKHASKPGLRGKIDAMCIECIYEQGQGGGTWVQQVRDCQCVRCPLYSVRRQK